MVDCKPVEVGDTMATQAQRDAMMKIIAKNKARALFDNVDDFVGVFEQYLDEVKKDEAHVPTYSNFAKWLGNVSPNSIYKFMQTNPSARDATAELMADALAEGAILGRFRDAPAIFALKNRCNWTDKKESISKHETSDIATPTEAREHIKRMMKSFGFDAKNRPRKGSQEHLDEMSERIIRLAEAKSEAEKGAV
jgi:hypothetical protein